MRLQSLWKSGWKVYWVVAYLKQKLKEVWDRNTYLRIINVYWSMLKHSHAFLYIPTDSTILQVTGRDSLEDISNVTRREAEFWKEELVEGAKNRFVAESDLRCADHRMSGDNERDLTAEHEWQLNKISSKRSEELSQIIQQGTLLSYSILSLWILVPAFLWISWVTVGIPVLSFKGVCVQLL